MSGESSEKIFEIILATMEKETNFGVLHYVCKYCKYHDSFACIFVKRELLPQNPPQYFKPFLDHLQANHPFEWLFLTKGGG